MNFVFVASLSYVIYLTACHCWTRKDEKNNVCGGWHQWIDSTTISMEMNKQGFHRELVTTVQFNSDVPHDLRVLLVYRWPKGVYVDPYQLASLRDHSDFQILLDSAIDLEVPARKAMKFVAFVYPTLVENNPRVQKATIPIHARYHVATEKPSEKFVFVNLGPPELLLRTDICTHPYYLEPHTIVDAPCTAANSTICSWVTVQHQQGPGHVSLPVPVGDRSLVTAVCTGTLLVTMICCVALSKNICKHGIF